jgi:hypothetical protein
MELLRKAPTKLSAHDADFDRQRFEFYASERKTNLDDRANKVSIRSDCHAAISLEC